MVEIAYVCNVWEKVTGMEHTHIELWEIMNHKNLKEIPQNVLIQSLYAMNAPLRITLTALICCVSFSFDS